MNATVVGFITQGTPMPAPATVVRVRVRLVKVRLLCDTSMNLQQLVKYIVVSFVGFLDQPYYNVLPHHTRDLFLFALQNYHPRTTP